jgi:hypothetical protein
MAVDHNPKGYDEKIIREMCLVGCTRKEIAAALGVHTDVLTKNTYFQKQMSAWDAELAFKIRKVQIQVAIETKDTKMLMWLGKVLLGQQEPAKEVIVTTSQLSDDDIEKQIKNLLPACTPKQVHEAILNYAMDLKDQEETVENGFIDNTRT